MMSLRTLELLVCNITYQMSCISDAIQHSCAIQSHGDSDNSSDSDGCRLLDAEPVAQLRLITGIIRLLSCDPHSLLRWIAHLHLLNVHICCYRTYFALRPVLNTLPLFLSVRPTNSFTQSRTDFQVQSAVAAATSSSSETMTVRTHTLESFRPLRIHSIKYIDTAPQ